MSMTTTDLFAILPLGILVAWGLLLLLTDLWVSKKIPWFTPVMAVLGLVAALVVTIMQADRSGVAFGGMVRVDGFSVFLNALFTLSAIAAIGLAYDYLKRLQVHRGEYYVLLLFSVSGMMLMAAAGDLIVVFLALELLSIPLYILAGMVRPDMETKEASLKYFLLGTFASGFVLFGTALVFGATQTTNLATIMTAVNADQVDWILLVIGGGMLLGGFAFKVAVVPFHGWTPDVYHGSPSSVMAFMTVGAKAAGFAALIRVFSLALASLTGTLTPVFWALAALTMIVGNVVAIAQANLKRMLAYSSIAHAGYLTMALVTIGDEAVRSEAIASVLFYLAAYAATSLGAWAVLIAVEKADGSGNEINDLAGLGRRAPLLAAVMAVFMLSFTGIPLTLGFWGKFYLFRTAINGGEIGLAVIGLLTSLVSAFYYLRVIVKMYFQEGEVQVSRCTWVYLVAIAAALLVVGLAFFPGLLFGYAGTAWVFGI